MMPSPDTGAALRALYEPQGGVRSVFSDKVADYVASRPDYPLPLFDALRAGGGLTDGALVADLGAGTGLLTHGLLSQRWQVVAVEPNPAMRAACDAWLGGQAGYRSVEGSAESIPLAAASVDLITAAQAFHWFELDRARDECLRVLRPRGQVALIWNDRVLQDPLHVALDELFAEFGGSKRSALLAHEDRAGVPRFFADGPSAERAWPHVQMLDRASLLSLVCSRSYMPARDTAMGRVVAQRVDQLFERLAVDQTVPVRYRTVLIVGRPG